jgi:exopolyphosphatase / guanosine-5'-triphosphate,3'-diphosphate pyrophosphatase
LPLPGAIQLQRWFKRRPRTGGEPQAALEEGQTRQSLYAALDLGTNNCRLLIARPEGRGFRIVDSFSKIVRLGEGLASTGALSPQAIGRCLDALATCADRLSAHTLAGSRLVATEACRAASNGASFLESVKQQTGLVLETIERGTEAELAAAGCSALMSRNSATTIIFDIGGGSTEIIWLDADRNQSDFKDRIRAWTSLPVGVVTLSERFGGKEVTNETYTAMVDDVRGLLGDFGRQVPVNQLGRNFHLLGTSGTVTTLGALHLKLPRYERRHVDGLWMTTADAQNIIHDLRNTPFEARRENACIGRERADLVLAGCAIYEAIAEAFPSRHLRIADRGLREGILMQLMRADQSSPLAAQGQTAGGVA